MPLPTISDTYRAAFLWRHDSLQTNAVNVMHFAKSGGSESDLATKLDAHVTQAMWAQTDTNGYIHSVDITKLDGSSATLTHITGSGSHWQGTGSTHDPLPAQCVIVKLITAKRGRSYRGRVYLPWATESNVDKALVLGTLYTSLTAAWSAFLAAMTGDGWNPVVASYRLQTSENIVAMPVERYTATQRRRLKRSSVT